MLNSVCITCHLQEIVTNNETYLENGWSRVTPDITACTHQPPCALHLAGDKLAWYFSFYLRTASQIGYQTMEIGAGRTPRLQDCVKWHHLNRRKGRRSKRRTRNPASNSQVLIFLASLCHNKDFFLSFKGCQYILYLIVMEVGASLNQKQVTFLSEMPMRRDEYWCEMLLNTRPRGWEVETRREWSGGFAIERARRKPWWWSCNWVVAKWEDGPGY